jgi:hypothetical protein
VVPCEFIGVVKSQQSVYLKGELVSNHDELMCNFFAQVGGWVGWVGGWVGGAWQRGVVVVMAGWCRGQSGAEGQSGWRSMQQPLLMLNVPPPLALLSPLPAG